MPRRSRVRAGELLIRRWRLPTWWVLILPLAVILKRFLAPDLVFILDISLFLFGTRTRPVRSPLVECAGRRTGVALRAATACPAGPLEEAAFKRIFTEKSRRKRLSFALWTSSRVLTYVRTLRAPLLARGQNPAREPVSGGIISRWCHRPCPGRRTRR